MKFDELDLKMRRFETAHDHCVLPGLFMVARLDGRSFTRLTKEVHRFESPFDVRVRDMMLETVCHLMDCGFRFTYGYTQSDEISLLFARDDNAFHRKLRKLLSILAGEASAKFSLLLKDMAVFDCRISQLPTETEVINYFRWRSEDAHRNALNAHCYWALRREGKDAKEATSSVAHLSNAEKNELLFQRGINFNGLPNWHKRGSGVYWEDYSKESQNPHAAGELITVTRRRLKIDLELPIRDAYDEFLRRRLELEA